MSQYDEGYSKELVVQAKKDIQTLVKEKSLLVKVDFSKQENSLVMMSSLNMWR